MLYSSVSTLKFRVETFEYNMKHLNVRNRTILQTKKLAPPHGRGKPGENKARGRQTKLEASLFISKLTSRDYKITVLQLQQFKEY